MLSTVTSHSDPPWCRIVKVNASEQALTAALPVGELLNRERETLRGSCFKPLCSSIGSILNMAATKPFSFAPMLCETAEWPPDGRNWQYELKF
jgi:hypothetical protein